MLPEVISGSIGPLDVVSPLRRLLSRTRVQVRAVESIDLKAKTLTASTGVSGHPHVVSFDHLVLATGNVLAQVGGARREHFQAGEVVFDQGDVGDRIYMIASGRVEVVRDDQVLATLGAGDVFGEMALLGNTPRSATIRCVEPVRLLSLPRRDFALLAESLPDLRRTFERVMRSRAA
jgi:hypothetical protein